VGPEVRLGRGRFPDVGRSGSHPARRRRIVIAALSVITLGGILVQAGAALTIRDSTWPVVGFGMFRGSGEEYVDPRVFVTTSSGRSLELTGADLGIRELELDRHVLRKVSDPTGTRLPDGRRHLAELIRAWSERHPGERAVGGLVRLDVHPVPEGEPIRQIGTVRWRQ
jgi:hypothetical protein